MAILWMREAMHVVRFLYTECRRSLTALDVERAVSSKVVLAPPCIVQNYQCTVLKLWKLQYIAQTVIKKIRISFSKILLYEEYVMRKFSERPFRPINPNPFSADPELSITLTAKPYIATTRRNNY